MNAQQWVFIGTCVLLLAYLVLRAFSWLIRHTDWLAAGIDWVFSQRRGYRLVRMEPVEEETETPERDPLWLRPRFFLSSYGLDSKTDSAVDTPIAEVAKNATTPVAMLQNGNNDAIVIAALARLVATGELGQTAAIKTGMGITPSSTSVRYVEVRAALKAEVERIKGEMKPAIPLTDEQRAWRKDIGLEA